MTRKQKRLGFRILSALALFLAFFAMEHAFLSKWEVYFTFIPYFLIYLWIGYDVLLRAFRNIRGGQIFDENLLMTVATLGALSIGFLPNGEAEFHEAVFVMLFYQAGEWFQSIAVGKSRRSIRALLQIRPDSANLCQDEETVCVSPDTLSVGDRILIRPGERVPTDGVVLVGSSALDMAALTGESLPREVAPDGEVYSGSVNLHAVLEVRVTRPASESTASRILDLVQSASEKKARSENFISRFARYYTPFVLFSAVLLALLPPLFSGSFGESFLLWFTRALTFLVISCPCALVISVPLSYFSGIGAASRMGVLVKGSMYLESLAEVRTAVFDKTGTLTSGAFRVTSVRATMVSDAALLQLAASAESASTHPLARAVVSAVSGDLLPAEEVVEHSGRGISCRINGKALLAGKASFLLENGAACPEEDPPQQGGSEIHVAYDGSYYGVIALSDAPRENAAETVEALSKMGVESVMLTGDRAPAARLVAESLGIRRYIAECMPEDKVNALEKILSEGASRNSRVAFVGDGINDAPALTRADCGIAMGGLGSDAAIEASDIVLMQDDLASLVSAIALSKRTRRIVKENIAFTLSVKAAVLLFGAFGLCPMGLAVFADVGVAFLAILNAMRAGKKPSV